MATRLYLDTVTIINAVESENDEVAGRLGQLWTSEATICVSSELTLAELLVGAWRPDKEEDWLAVAYESIFSKSETLTVIPVERRILVRAAKLRAADLSLKLPDAIQLATALSADCAIMLSNDGKLLRSAERHGLSICFLKNADLEGLLARIAPAP